jgi:hypothetical protein
MGMNITEQKRAALEFQKAWQGRGDEKQDTQRFWIDLFHSVFGIDNPARYIEFEKRVKLEESTRFIDVYIPDTRVLIEQKGMNVDLSRPELQSGGASLTPYNQARRYDNNLPVHEKARWIICCNFRRFEIHDMNNPLGDPEVVLLEDLQKDYGRLAFLADVKVDTIRKEEEISIMAGKIVGNLYDRILPQYQNPDYPDTLKSLNQLCVRLVFCLYAEDTGLFGEKDRFYKYLSGFRTGQLRKALIDLFEVFDTPYEERDSYMDPDLAAFPYIKGGIFTDQIEIPQFTDEIVDLLCNQASLEVDWSNISPTVFGAVFESTLNPATRHQGGMHYTSVENIHKVIDPLFLDSLKEELEDILKISVKGRRDRMLSGYQDRLAALTFLDPACGSGNFLTETYLSLRRLENRVLEALGAEGMLWLGEEFSPIKVKIDQFYGIEINDFAVSVARTALWIAESQTMKETEHIVGRPIEYFPLKENPNIVEGNALRIDWDEVVPASKLNFIMGNPPFIGYAVQTIEQKGEVRDIFTDEEGNGFQFAGKIDYVAAWYRKAVDYMKPNKSVHAAFVSTNSVVQGEQVAFIWKDLFENRDMELIFAYRTFQWDSEAFVKAHVHCVILGFRLKSEPIRKYIYDKTGRYEVRNINAYLIDAPDVYVESRTKPVCDVPKMIYGSKPVDGGFLILSEQERLELIAENPSIEPYVRLFLGAEEFIYSKKRYCLWLVDASPKVIRESPSVIRRIEGVRSARLASKKAATRKIADTPMLFAEIRHVEKNYLAVPEVTGENRKYVPIGFMSPDVVCSNKIQLIPDATVYDFGILTSVVNMAWMRVVCGRLGMSYDYSAKIVYNNFPWPSPTQAQKARIEKTAQAIHDARHMYPDCSLADLYDEAAMPTALRRAHRENDKAVMEAYGFDAVMDENMIVSELFRIYKIKTAQ